MGLPPSVSLSLHLSMQKTITLHSNGASKSVKYIQDPVVDHVCAAVLPQSHFRPDCPCCQWNVCNPKVMWGRSATSAGTPAQQMSERSVNLQAHLQLICIYCSCPHCHSHAGIIHLRQSLLSTPVLLSPVQTTTEAWFNKQLSNTLFLCFTFFFWGVSGKSTLVHKWEDINRCVPA